MGCYSMLRLLMTKQAHEPPKTKGAIQACTAVAYLLMTQVAILHCMQCRTGYAD